MYHRYDPYHHEMKKGGPGNFLPVWAHPDLWIDPQQDQRTARRAGTTEGVAMEPGTFDRSPFRRVRAGTATTPLGVADAETLAYRDFAASGGGEGYAEATQ